MEYTNLEKIAKFKSKVLDYALEYILDGDADKEVKVVKEWVGIVRTIEESIPDDASTTRRIVEVEFHEAQHEEQHEEQK